MDSHKNYLVIALTALCLIFITSAIVIFITVDGTIPSVKTTNVFELIFALVALLALIVTSLYMHADRELEGKALFIILGLFIIALFYIISTSITIDMINNPISATVSGAKSTLILPAIGAMITVPAIAGAGYLLSV